MNIIKKGSKWGKMDFDSDEKIAETKEMLPDVGFGALQLPIQIYWSGTKHKTKSNCLDNPVIQ